MLTPSSFFDWTSAAVRTSLGTVINLFTDERTGPFLAFVLFAAGCVFFAYILGFFLYFAFTLWSAAGAVGRATGRNEEERLRAFSQRFFEVDRLLLKNRKLSHAWREFRETLLMPDEANGDAIVSNSARPTGYFNLATLHMNFSFVRHTPNIFVGLGLLGTFLGLISALTAALGSFTPGAGAENAQDAIRKLLTTASAKFYVSAAALAVSIVLTLELRALSALLSRQVAKFNNMLEERLRFMTVETIASRQSEYIKEQTSQLKLFSTDLAMTIGRSVKEAVSETNSALLEKLEGIAGTFSALVEASRVGAGEAVSRVIDGAVTSSLKHTSDTMESVGASLATLPQAIEEMAKRLDQVASASAQHQLDVSEQIQEKLRAALTQGGQAMVDALQAGTAGTVGQLSTTSATLEKGASAISSVLHELGTGGSALAKTINEIASVNETILKGLNSAAVAVTDASKELSSSTSGIADHVRDVRSAVTMLRDQAASFAEAMQATQEQARANVERLAKEWERHVGRFDGVDAKLAEIFNTVSEQISLQTQQMRNHVEKVDTALGRAVGTLELAVQDFISAKG